MPFKVRFRLIAFMGDEEKYPCHFGYKIGDEIIYDGEKFTGRICLSLLPNMAPAVKILHDLGGKGSMRSLIQYSGHSKRDPGMKKYDGLGYAPFKEDPSRGSMSAMQAGALAVSCNDSRTSALLVAEPFGLASAGFDMPYYMREMSIL